MRAAQPTHLAELLEEVHSDYVRAKNPSWASRLDGAFDVVLLMAEAEARAEERARCGDLFYEIWTELPGRTHRSPAGGPVGHLQWTVSRWRLRRSPG